MEYNKQTFDKLKSDHTKEVDKLKSDHTKEVDKLKSDHATEIEKLEKGSLFDEGVKDRKVIFNVIGKTGKRYLQGELVSIDTATLESMLGCIESIE